MTDPARTPPATAIPNGVLLRDVLIFELKLWLDGLKDFVLAPLAALGAIADVLFGAEEQGYRVYRVMRAGERFDLWLNLYAPAKHAEQSGEGLFGASRSTDDTLLGQLERATGGERE